MTGIYTVVGWALDQSGVPSAPTFQLDGQTVFLTDVQRTSRSIYPVVTPMVTGNGTYTFGIVTTDHSGHSFFSREANPAYYRPYLEVTY